MADNISTELRLASLEARLRAQEVVLQCLCKAIATLDGRSAHAVAVALEVADLLRRFREQFEPGSEAYYGRG